MTSRYVGPFVDKNRNDRQDPDEPTVGDASLLRQLGANTLRAYHHIHNRALFRRLYKEYGLYVLCGDILLSARRDLWLVCENLAEYDRICLDRTIASRT